jgi:hypothetical protein
VLELAHHLATLLHVDESIHYFHIILSILNTPVSVGGSTQQHQQEEEGLSEETWQREVLLIKIKTFLGLGFLHKELNQCEKASRFIDQAQELNKQLAATSSCSTTVTWLAEETFIFAKFSICCRANDTSAAEAAL